MFIDDEGEPELQVLSRAECMTLIAGVPIGRLAVSRAQQGPLVVPVNYVLDGEVIVFRSDAGAKLFLLKEEPVGFQVDQIDPVRRSGWSVLIDGMAREASRDEIDHLVLQPWAGGAKQHWVRISPRTVTGRRITLPAVRHDSRGYL